MFIKVNRVIFALIISFILLAQGTIYAKETASTNIIANPTKSNILVNDVSQQLEAYSFDNYNYFKLRDIAYILNRTGKQFDVAWNSSKNAVELISNKNYTANGSEMQLSDLKPAKAKRTNTKFYLDNAEVYLTTYGINGNNYVKLRNIAALLDIKVTWYSTLNLIGLSTGDPVVWRVMWLIMPKVEAKLKDSTTFTINMTDSDIEKVTEMASRFENNIETASNNQVDISVDVFISQQTVSSLSIFSGNSYYVSPKDIPDDAKAVSNNYDSVVANVRLSGESCTISNDWWGLGGSQVPSSTYCVVQMLPGYDLSWYLEANDNVPHPEEIWVHEWVLCLDSFYNSLGYITPGSGYGERYGYKSDSKVGFHGYYKYYSDIFNNEVYDSINKKFIGITPDMWQLHPLMKYNQQIQQSLKTSGNNKE
jgi:hypothetical protein